MEGLVVYVMGTTVIPNQVTDSDADLMTSAVSMSSQYCNIMSLNLEEMEIKINHTNAFKIKRCDRDL